MALNATVYNFEINLSDLDRNVYQALSLRVAKHPAETDEYLVTRVLAYCLEYCEGLSFSKGGLSDPDSPALSVHDLTGALLGWIEIGLPDAARLHRASKASPRVAVYAHKNIERLLTQMGAQRIHRVNEIQVNTFDPEMIESLCSRLTRRMLFDLVITERQLYLTVGKDTISGNWVRHSAPQT